MKQIKNVSSCTGGGGSPEQSQEVVSEYQFVGNNEQLSARRGRPRSFAQARTLAFSAKGGEPARAAFTMAEILLSLTIIGVVAAITLPSLTGNINERTWNTQRKALYARFSQALSLMPALNGYGTLIESTDESGSTTIEDTAAETFVTSGLSRVLKINNICDNEHLPDCGIPDKIQPVVGSNTIYTSTDLTNLFSYNQMFSSIPTEHGVYSQVNTKSVAFETVNGESILAFYNPYCVSAASGFIQSDKVQKYMCANFVYDLNGKKGPNVVGKDIGFMSVLYPVDSVVLAPIPLARGVGATSNYSPGELNKKCRLIDNDSRVPTIYELASLAYNTKLFGWSGHTWSATPISSTSGWTLVLSSGLVAGRSYTEGTNVRCIKR